MLTIVGEGIKDIIDKVTHVLKPMTSGWSVTNGGIQMVTAGAENALVPLTVFLSTIWNSFAVCNKRACTCGNG